MDRWDGTIYRRVFVLGGGVVPVAVRQVGEPDAARLVVDATSEDNAIDLEPAVTVVLQRVLGLGIDLQDFYACAETDPHLGPLAHRFRGMKPPRYPSLFEALANAIACQQITLTFGIRVLNALTEAWGPAAAGNDHEAHAFPRPSDIASLEPDTLRVLAFSQQKARALVEASRAIVTGDLALDDLAHLDDEAAVHRLRELRGVGRWTAEYVLLRGLGRLNIFPGDDVGARGNLERWLAAPDRLDYAGVQRVLSPWHPYGGLVYLHLLLDKLAAAGYVHA
ncbi:MAG: DNA-3-methyladenine glycosylase 2 family protein [Chloroflexi bacterium]|nr:DNA-3-methyladenine glycosylase 2 family protein [Chloroflexota bacterium]